MDYVISKKRKEIKLSRTLAQLASPASLAHRAPNAVYSYFALTTFHTCWKSLLLTALGGGLWEPNPFTSSVYLHFPVCFSSGVHVPEGSAMPSGYTAGTSRVTSSKAAPHHTWSLLYEVPSSRLKDKRRPLRASRNLPSSENCVMSPKNVHIRKKNPLFAHNNQTNVTASFSKTMLLTIYFCYTNAPPSKSTNKEFLFTSTRGSTITIYL